MYKVLSFLRSTYVVDTFGWLSQVGDSHSLFLCFFLAFASGHHKQASRLSVILMKRRWRIISVNRIYTGVNGIGSRRRLLLVGTVCIKGKEENRIVRSYYTERRTMLAGPSSSLFCTLESRFSSTDLKFSHKTIELLVCGSSVK